MAAGGAPRGRRTHGVVGLIVRIALLGGGGFRAPIVYAAVRTIDRTVPVDELVLCDISADRLRRIHDVIRGLRAEGDGPDVRTTTSLEEAVTGASFVLS